jgi:iron complex outermembrane recepter protein
MPFFAGQITCQSYGKTFGIPPYNPAREKEIGRLGFVFTEQKPRQCCFRIRDSRFCLKPSCHTTHIPVLCRDVSIQLKNSMKPGLLLLLLLAAASPVFSQQATLNGHFTDEQGTSLEFATAVLYRAADSAFVKAALTDANGHFEMSGLPTGKFFLQGTYVGLRSLRRDNVVLAPGQTLQLGTLKFPPAVNELDEVTVSAIRPIVEARPDRTVFNVQGTINASGADGMSLLRKAPAVVIDNNDNILVLGRGGTLVYVDGRRLPLVGQDLTNYLQSLSADQIDRIDIITSPGAKYDAQGNAGIIDIRLKKDKNLGANGSVALTYGQGQNHNATTNVSGNYRNKKLNLFGNAGWGDRRGWMRMDFESTQNGLYLGEIVRPINDFTNLNARLGADWFLAPKHTIGVLLSGFDNEQTGNMLNRITIAPASNPSAIDSILSANTRTESMRRNGAANLNYRFDQGNGRSLSLDIDLAQFNNTNLRRQSNAFNSVGGETLTSALNVFDTPTDIQIFTAKTDYEDKLLGGTLGVGAKFSRVYSQNQFFVFDEKDGQQTRDDRRSNLFDYDEKVAAVYTNYARPLAKNWNLSAGLRMEKTDATGDLQAFLPDLQEPPVVLDYWSWFPSAGISWARKPTQIWSVGYSRRINRPDYHVLNPFNNQMSALSFEKGNPFLKPEIVNNAELGLTLQHRFSFKLGYSVTTDQITRLIGPDEVDPRANFISWDNLAEQKVLGFNASLPFSPMKWWDVYLNLSAQHINNRADYGGNAVVDVQVFTYNIYQQSTFNLGGGWRGEVSGWFSGPGVWGGVFITDAQWSLDLGIQKKFFADRLSLRLNAQDIFYQSYWSGYSDFNGLYSAGSGRWDARRATISATYNFGNQNVKSRRRETGLEDEAKRVGG